MAAGSTYDVIVLGLGAMGSAAAYHCAARGARVLGLERFDIPHALGSSHGHTRMTRTAYYEHPDYVPLLHRANDLWRDLERETNTALLHQVGGVYMGPEDGEVVPGSLRAAREHGLDYALLSNAELDRRFPRFHLPDHYIGIHEPAAGYLMVENCIAAHATAALQRGATLHGREGVRHWAADSAGVEVITSRATYRGRHLVLTAGPWTTPVSPDFPVPLTVTRQLLAWFWPKDVTAFADGPVWGIEAPEGLFYGFPMRPEVPGVKIALHAPGPATHPDRVARDLTPTDLTALRTFLSTTLPAADGPLLSAKVCLYTNSPDHHFLLGPHPNHPRTTIAAGFSGHGFKFASVVGHALADLALTGATGLPIAFLSPNRFASGRPA